MFILLELSEGEPIQVRLLSDRKQADTLFEAMSRENKVYEYSLDALHAEVEGTIRLAGDDAYSVQLIQKEPE